MRVWFTSQPSPSSSSRSHDVQAICPCSSHAGATGGRGGSRRSGSASADPVRA